MAAFVSANRDLSSTLARQRPTHRCNCCIAGGRSLNIGWSDHLPVEPWRLKNGRPLAASLSS